MFYIPLQVGRSGGHTACKVKRCKFSKREQADKRLHNHTISNPNTDFTEVHVDKQLKYEQRIA